MSVCTRPNEEKRFAPGRRGRWGARRRRARSESANVVSGGGWESNPPAGVSRRTGFEDRREDLHVYLGEFGRGPGTVRRQDLSHSLVAQD